MKTRERLLMDAGWRFALGHATDPARDFDSGRDRSLVKAGEARGAARALTRAPHAAAPAAGSIGATFDDSGWRVVDLPHDWAVELGFDRGREDREHVEHGFVPVGPDYPQNSVGWYRKTFAIPNSDAGRRIFIEFDGAFRDSAVWVNGHRMGRHASGYTPFRFDITDQLNYGGDNVVAVRCDASQFEGWWYEGAGLYRHVWLVKHNPSHFEHDSVVVRSKVAKDKATLTIESAAQHDQACVVVHTIVDPTGKTIATKRGRRAGSTNLATVTLRKPLLWSLEDPHLYRLVSRLERNGDVLDEVTTRFGIRTTRWDPDRGFFLNGKPVKIKGTCNHRDHAGVGAAVPDRIHRLRIEKLKAMGSNAFRCAHYPHAAELLDACDELGMLVMCENRVASSAPEPMRDFATMIRRDRNRPSVILWSIGNEEHTIQWSPAGERIGRTLIDQARRLDPTRPVTAAMHDKGLGAGFANVVDVHGWNYMKVGDIEAHHRRRPDVAIVGSEEASTVTTRGEYADDKARGYLTAYDVRAPGWGMTAEAWWTFFADRPWLAGGFVWTGFDYRGEPIPYKWPCTTSHFGLMDLCGFPKDLYFFYQSWWQSEPVLHLFPHWNWTDAGRPIDVRCFSNLDSVELLVNGRSVGRQTMKRNSHVGWTVPFEPGRIEAVGRSGNRIVRRQRIETTGPAVRIELSSDRTSLRGDGEDVACVTASVFDQAGRRVPTDGRLVRFEIDGPGRLVGVGNGDPSSHEPDKASTRSLFNGLALAIIQSTVGSGSIKLTATADGVKTCTTSIRVDKSRRRAFI
jgi:beta-galactosidase